MSLFLNGDGALVYSLILGRDSDNPIPLVQLADRAHLSPREVKAIVESLRVEHRVPIGARRSKPNGYYYARTVEELEQSAAPMIHQAKRMLQAASRLLGKKRVRELLGQGVLG